jgi:hypothetical protein
MFLLDNHPEIRLIFIKEIPWEILPFTCHLDFLIHAGDNNMFFSVA